jgi:hypothetical protein
VCGCVGAGVGGRACRLITSCHRVIACPRTLLQMIKYGVVGLPTFLQDLHHWSHLYIGGRLHKPVAVLAAQQDSQAAAQHNLRSALATALLLLPQRTATYKVRVRARHWRLVAPLPSQQAPTDCCRLPHCCRPTNTPTTRSCSSASPACPTWVTCAWAWQRTAGRWSAL